MTSFTTTTSALLTFLFLTVRSLFAQDCVSSPCFNIKSDLDQSINAGLIPYNFQIINNANNRPITDTDLMENHERLLHFIVFDSSLKEFRHVHPVFKNNRWNVELNLDTNGDYRIYVQGKTLREKKDFTISTQLKVKNGRTAHPIDPLGDIRTGLNGKSNVTLSNEILKAKKMVMPLLTFSRSDGQNPRLTPYLGSLAHIVIVSSDGKNFLHVHPMETESPYQLMLHTEFPKSGNYRIWIEFIESDELKTIPLSVNVKS